VSDIVFVILGGCDCWLSAIFEPLIIGITFPLTSKPPWQLLGIPKMFNLGKANAVWTCKIMGRENLLRKFLLECERLRTRPVDVVWQVLYFEPKHPVPDQEQS
jgi:hypothetical protein